jgi:plasmid stabilization system protein ParE
MKIRFLSLANQEVDDAVRWYEKQAQGLSRDFLDELDRVVRLVSKYPRIATEIEPEIRRFLFTRFPYSLIYGIEQENIVVIAVAHQHREPRYWADRIDKAAV